jgi:predicted MPP superfamily phosphohydrolase
MKVLKTGYVLQMALVAAIIIIVGGYELPKYASRLIVLAVLAVIDMRYWFSVRKYFTIRFKGILTIAYWLPLYTLLLFFISSFLIPYIEWNSFLRIYFPAILLILLIGKGLFLTMIVFGDIFIIPLNVIRHINPENIERMGKWYRPRIFLLGSAVIASIVMMLYISGMFFWVNDYKLEKIELPVKNLPQAFDGYKVVQISDFHLGGFLNDKPMKDIVTMVNEQDPDVILFTGDMVSFTSAEVFPFEEEMKQFSAKDGIYSILGNHDYGEYTRWDSPEDKELNDKELFEFYDRLGWNLLRNQNEVLRRDSSSIALIGVENWSQTKRFGKKGDLRKAYTGTDSVPFKILMSHDPSHWDGEVNTIYPQIALTLSGHTHAFQFAIENGSVKWSPASLLFEEWGGLYEKVHENGEKQYLYVNRGAGTLGYPGRIFTRPEITLIVLRRAS